MKKQTTLKDFLKSCVNHKEVSTHPNILQELETMSHYQKTRLVNSVQCINIKRIIHNDFNTLDYYEISYRLKRNGTSFYIKTTIEQHIKITTKTVKIFSPNKLNWSDFHEFLSFLEVKLNYMGEGCSYFYKLIQKPSILKDLLTGRIYNLESCVKRYCLHSFHITTGSWKILNRLLSGELYYFDIQDLKTFSTNFENALFIINNLYSTDSRKLQLLQDVFRLAVLLNEKVNFNWSSKRLQLEHARQIRLCAEFDFSAKSSKAIHSDIISTQTIKLLNTEKEVFLEGNTMHHCIYTCYYNRIARQEYIAFHMSVPENCTFGIIKNRNGILELDQIYAKYDRQVEDATRDLAIEFMHKNEQKLLKLFK